MDGSLRDKKVEEASYLLMYLCRGGEGGWVLGRQEGGGDQLPSRQARRSQSNHGKVETADFD